MKELRMLVSAMLPVACQASFKLTLAEALHPESML